MRDPPTEEVSGKAACSLRNRATMGRLGRTASLWIVLSKAILFVDHYMTERFHQGLGGQLIRKQVGPTNDNGAAGKIVRRSRLGGMLNYYSREAA